MNAKADDLFREPPEGSLTAAEYVLGVLDAVALRAAEMRLQREPAFGYEVAAWQARLTPLLDEIAPVPAPFALWPRIRAAAGIADPAAPAAIVRDGTDTAPALASALRLWRWLTAGGFAAAAIAFSALFLLPHGATPPVTPSHEELVATMAQDDGKALFVATIDARTGRIIVQPLAVNIPTDRAAELWIIAPGNVPHSLGVIDAHNAQPVIIPNNLRAEVGAKSVVAVTLEPPGGSPTGNPTGPVIAKGELALL